MKASREVVLVALGILAGVVVVPAAAEDQRAACSLEVAQARAMVAKAQGVIRAGRAEGSQVARTPLAGPGSSSARTPQEGPSAVAGRTPLLDQGTGTARGLATSAASDISPWNPQPTDKTLEARTSKAQKLTAQASKLCSAGKTDEAKAKALEAITVLNPK